LPEENWDNQLEYLQKSRILAHNDDYLEFLVKKVWKLEKPVSLVDFGCGFGYMGTKLLPLLAPGSRYTGLDIAPALLEAGRHLYAKLPYTHEFLSSEVYRTPFEDGAFDVAIAHSVLMHIERPFEALKEMIRVTRPGGMVITANANRNAWQALFYIDELNTQETTSIVFTQQMNQHIRQQTGVDYNIGIKVPVMMDKLGLKNIGCRIDDRVTILFPSLPPAEKAQIFEALCISGLALPENYPAGRAQVRERLLGYGIAPEEIAKVLEFEEKMDFRHKGKGYHTLYPELAAWAYGTVVKQKKRLR
jgi:ubiquinone/menaquinone biosynthesis C-methylase UbiE